MKKEFQHRRKEKCGICEKPIDTTRDQWAAIIDLIGDKIMNVKFYHNNCLKDLITGKGKRLFDKVETDFKKQMGGVMKAISPLLKKLQGSDDKPVVYDIPNN